MSETTIQNPDDFEGGIPIDARDIPTEGVTLSESEVYPAVLERISVSMKLSKNGVKFCAVQVSIPEGDYEGMNVQTNYLPLPIGVRSDASKKEKIHATNTSAAFGRFCQSFRIQGQVPPVNLNNPESIQRFQDFMAKFYGNRGKIMIQNQMFNGRLRSGISDFIL